MGVSTGKKKRKLVAPEDGDTSSLKKSKLSETDCSSASTINVNPIGDDPLASVSNIQGEETNPKKKKKKSKKNKGGSQGAAIQTNGMASLFAKTTPNSSSKAGSSSHKASNKSFKDQMVKKSKQ